MPDAQRGGLSIFRNTPVVDNLTLAVGSTPYNERDQRVAALARGYAPTLVKDLQRLATDAATAHRARALIAVNSYRRARLFAAALYESALALGRKLKIFVATPDKDNPDLPPVPDAITLVTRDQFSQLADRGGDVLISPLPRTERGLNILTTAPSGKRESAITLIGLAIRPVMPVDEPAALSASIAACAWRSVPRISTPAARLAAIRKTARARLWTILAAPKRFTALPDDLRCELIATVLGQCIQLAGRGRRGQTHVELHLIDGAFHDTTWGTDLPTLAAIGHELPSAPDAEGRVRRLLPRIKIGTAASGHSKRHAVTVNAVTTLMANRWYGVATVLLTNPDQPLAVAAHTDGPPPEAAPQRARRGRQSTPGRAAAPDPPGAGLPRDP